MESSLFGMFQNTQIKLKNNSLTEHFWPLLALPGYVWHVKRRWSFESKKTAFTRPLAMHLNSTTGIRTLASRRNFHSGRRYSVKQTRLVSLQIVWRALPGVIALYSKFVRPTSSIILEKYSPVAYSWNLKAPLDMNKGEFGLKKFSEEQFLIGVTLLLTGVICVIGNLLELTKSYRILRY